MRRSRMRATLPLVALAAGCAAMVPGARVREPAAGGAAAAKPAAVPTAAAPAAPTWRRLESTHFTLTTTRSAAASDVILTALEEYFDALTTVCVRGTPPGPERIPVIVLASQAQSQDVLRPGMSGVFFSNIMYQPLIVLGVGEHGFQDGIVRHELVHYAVQLAFRRGMPRWFEEGLASYYESLAYDRVSGQLLLGRAHPGTPFELEKEGLVPTIAALVNGDLDDTIDRHAGRFYVSSWLLVHLLMHTAPDVFADYQRALLAGTDPKQAWLTATSATFRATIDGQLRAYAREKRYQTVRRVSWHAPSIAFRSRPVTPADVPATEALLHLVGASQQPAVAAAHKQKTLELVSQALGEDAASLLALRIALYLDRPVSIGDLRMAVQAAPDSWVAWLTLYDALGEDQRAHSDPGIRAERADVLARAVALAPDEVHVLLRRGNDAIRHGRLDEARSLFLRGLAFAPDLPAFYQGYLIALAAHPQCGKLAMAALKHPEETPEREWRRLIDGVEACRAAAPARKPPPGR